MVPLIALSPDRIDAAVSRRETFRVDVLLPDRRSCLYVARPGVACAVDVVAADRCGREPGEQDVAERLGARGGGGRLDHWQQPGDDGSQKDGEDEPADRAEGGFRIVAEPPGGQQRRRAAGPAQQSRRLGGQPRPGHHQADQDDEQAGVGRPADRLAVSQVESHDQQHDAGQQRSYPPRGRGRRCRPAAHAKRGDPDPSQRQQGRDRGGGRNTDEHRQVSRHGRRDLVVEVPRTGDGGVRQRAPQEQEDRDAEHRAEQGTDHGFDRGDDADLPVRGTHQPQRRVTLLAPGGGEPGRGPDQDEDREQEGDRADDE